MINCRKEIKVKTGTFYLQIAETELHPLVVISSPHQLVKKAPLCNLDIRRLYTKNQLLYRII